MTVEAAAARRLWHLFEPVHAVTYFAPEAKEAFVAAGLRGFWRGYFAGRAAPLGAPSAATVAATFFGFHPAMVARAVPEVWTMCPPAAVLDARLTGARAALRRLLHDDGVSARAVDEAGALLVAAVERSDVEGRPLAAANAALPVPDDRLLRLWQAATTLREHRGDGHVLGLVAAGVDGCEAHVLSVAAGRIDRPGLQPHRGWTDDDWAAATDRLLGRGLVAADGTLTEAGRDLRADVEVMTDRLAVAPFLRIGAARVDRLTFALQPLAAAVVRADVVPFPNPMGLPPPAPV